MLNTKDYNKAIMDLKNSPNIQLKRETERRSKIIENIENCLSFEANKKFQATLKFDQITETEKFILEMLYANKISYIDVFALKSYERECLLRKEFFYRLITDEQHSDQSSPALAQACNEVFKLKEPVKSSFYRRLLRNHDDTQQTKKNHGSKNIEDTFERILPHKVVVFLFSKEKFSSTLSVTTAKKILSTNSEGVQPYFFKPGNWFTRLFGIRIEERVCEWTAKDIIELVQALSSSTEETTRDKAKKIIYAALQPTVGGNFLGWGAKENPVYVELMKDPALLFQNFPKGTILEISNLEPLWICDAWMTFMNNKANKFLLDAWDRATKVDEPQLSTSGSASSDDSSIVSANSSVAQPDVVHDDQLTPVAEKDRTSTVDEVNPSAASASTPQVGPTH